jgi:hypothetical protein
MFHPNNATRKEKRSGRKPLKKHGPAEENMAGMGEAAATGEEEDGIGR